MVKIVHPWLKKKKCTEDKNREEYGDNCCPIIPYKVMFLEDFTVTVLTFAFILTANTMQVSLRSFTKVMLAF